MRGQEPVEETSATAIVGRALSLYGSSITSFITPFIASGAVHSILVWFLDQFVPSNLSPVDYMNWVTGNLATVIAVLALFGLIEWIVHILASGMAVKVTANLLEGNPASPKESAYHTARKLPALLTAGLMTGLLTIAGLILFIIPGILFIVMFSFVTPAIILEGGSSMESLQRSRELVRRRRGTTFVVQFLTLLISVTLTWLVGDLNIPLGPVTPLISLGVSVLVQPINPIALTVLFHSAKVQETPPATRTPHGVIGFCSQCGSKLSPEEEYCPNCGQKREGAIQY